MTLPPALLFAPRYKDRPWGGRAIAGVGGHPPIPEGRRVGESWDLVDREGDESAVADGPLRGRTIRELLDAHGEEIMGRPWPRGRRFPLLVKVIDAAERLSLQVHPPAAVAAGLGGEPKTETWYLLDAAPSAALLAGFRKGATRAVFERALRAGDDAQLGGMVHRLPVKRGDALFTPSGRVHAIDAGCLILEIQQSSDTTYRVCDWGRVGLDGKPRQLHVEESLRSIDFADFEPSLAPRGGGGGARLLAACPHFRVEEWAAGAPVDLASRAPVLLHPLGGPAEVSSASGRASVPAGATALLPAGARRLALSSPAVVAFVGE
jgi:mannose-6-phosphate isomerase